MAMRRTRAEKVPLRRLSMHPLTPEDALRAALSIPPPPKAKKPPAKKAASKKKRRS